MKLKQLHEGLQHPACLRSLKQDVAAGKHRQAELAHTYSISPQRVSYLARRGRAAGPPQEAADPQPEHETDA